MMVGKTGAGPSCKQDEINALMVMLARAGKRVVRLKGGDPMIFGRAGEEIAACRAAGIAVEVVPGITAAQGAASRLGGVADATRRGATAAVRHWSRRKRPFAGRLRLAKHCRSHCQHGGLHAEEDVGRTGRCARSRAAFRPIRPLLRLHRPRGPSETDRRRDDCRHWRQARRFEIAGPVLVFVGRAFREAAPPSRFASLTAVRSRHCERSEAVQYGTISLDCFVAHRGSLR